MTHLVDLKITEAERKKRDKDHADGPVRSLVDTYPYGLQLRFDDPSLEKLGIDSMPKVGRRVRVIAECSVRSTSENSTTTGGKDRKNRTMELQVEKIALDIDGGSATDAVDKALKELAGGED
jgi:hypothetical protein